MKPTPGSLWTTDITDEPKTLLALRVQAKVDDLFRALWVAPELQVRFDSPPAPLATRPFQTEEIHHCQIYLPGQRYLVESQASTSAPYGDKFDLYFRATMLAESRTSSFLHVSFCCQWSPSMNRMMKGMISKAVEGGVRGTYRQYRQLLEAQFPLEEWPEGQMVEAVPERLAAPQQQQQQANPPMAAAPPPAAAKPQVEESARLAAAEAAPPLPTPAPAPALAPSLLVWADTVAVVSELAGAGLSSLAAKGTMAHVMAGGLCLMALHLLVQLLQAVQGVCRNRSGVLGLVCRPITHWLDLPDSLAEVLTSLGLLLAVNWGMQAAGRRAMVVARSHGLGQHSPPTPPPPLKLPSHPLSPSAPSSPVKGPPPGQPTSSTDTAAAPTPATAATATEATQPNGHPLPPATTSVPKPAPPPALAPPPKAVAAPTPPQ
ncbi:hypothetical protein QJQ45_030224, partial [Haematococcus lacustris]